VLRGAGFVFVDETKGGVVPAPLVSAVEAGVKAAMSRGVREGVPFVDCEVALLDGQVHAKDSSAVAFEIAGSLPFQEAVAQAGGGAGAAYAEGGGAHARGIGRCGAG
jgi:elongation factor G